MIGQKFIINMIIKQVMKAIKKASDKEIASNHEKRIKALEKNSHPKVDFVCTGCGCKAKRKTKKGEK